MLTCPEHGPAVTYYVLYLFPSVLSYCDTGGTRDHGTLGAEQAFLVVLEPKSINL